MLGFLAGLVLSLLPKRYRDRFPEFLRGNLRLGAVVSGLFQCLGCLAIFCVRYLIFLQRNVGALADRVIAQWRRRGARRHGGPGRDGIRQHGGVRLPSTLPAAHLLHA